MVEENTSKFENQLNISIDTLEQYIKKLGNSKTKYQRYLSYKIFKMEFNIQNQSVRKYRFYRIRN